MCLKGFGENLPTHFPTLDLLAVLHLVQEPEAYLRLLKKSLEKDAGGPALPFFSVQLPEPLEGLVPISSHKISAPALSQERQAFHWDLPRKEVMAARDKGLALVIEFFRYEFPAPAEAVRTYTQNFTLHALIRNKQLTLIAHRATKTRPFPFMDMRLRPLLASRTPRSPTAPRWRCQSCRSRLRAGSLPNQASRVRSPIWP